MIYRVYVEKKPDYAVEAQSLLKDLRENLNMPSLICIKTVNCYDIEGIGKAGYDNVKLSVLSEPQTDIITEEHYTVDPDEYAFRVKYLPGQYDQRSDSAEQCIMSAAGENARIESSRLYICKG